MKWSLRDWGMLGIITLVVIAFYFRLFWPVPHIIITPDFGQSDALGAISAKFIYSRALSDHSIPLWTSFIGGGYPIFALGTMATFFLPNLLFFFFLPPVIAYNITLVFSVCLLGWGMYLWIRCMEYGRLASLFGAITTILSGYCITQITHITIVQSYSLFPWLAVITLSLSRKKSWVLTGVFILFLSQQIFIGFPQCVFITLIFLCAYWLWLKPKNILFIIGILGGCFAAAAQILPSVEYLRTLVTAGGFDPGQTTYFSYPFKHLLTLLHPFFLGNPAAGTYPPFTNFGGSIFWENTAYIGIIPLALLAIYFIVILWKKIKIPQLKFFIIVFIASFLLMTGKYSPFYLLYSFWPFTLFRVPSRFIWLFEIALIIMSVHAFSKILKKCNTAAIILVCVHAIALYSIWSSYHLVEPAAPFLEKPSFVQTLDPAYNTISIGAESLYNETYMPHGWLYQKHDSSFFLRNTMTPDKSALWNIPQVADYTGRSIRRTDVFTALLNQSITSDTEGATISAAGKNLLSILSIKNIISTLPLTQEGLIETSRVSDSGNTITLYQNPDALPEMYFAKQAISVSTVQEAAADLLSDTFVPGSSVLVEFNATPSAATAHANVTIASFEEGSAVAHVTNPNKNAILVLTQTWYPGWHAAIDGRETPIFAVNIRHVGTLVPQGNHEVKFWYMPESFIVGAWISGSTLGVTVVLLVFGFVRSVCCTHQKVLLPSSRHRRNRGRSRLHN